MLDGKRRRRVEIEVSLETATRYAHQSMRRVAVFLLLSVLVGCGDGYIDPIPRQPNFIIILTDDQGWGDVGFHDNPDIRTPNLDAFAEEATEFTRFYVEPVCSPTRASILTGRYHYRTGVIHTSRGGAKMFGEETTLAERLRDLGYRTGIFGKWHLGDNYPMRPQDQGFEESLWHPSGGIGQPPDEATNMYFDPTLYRDGERVKTSGYCTDVFFDGALDFIERNKDEEFFVYLPTNAPHTPLQVAEEAWKPYADAGLDEDTARVYAMVENIDENVGRLTAKLDELGLSDQTYVVFLSDNGPQQRRFNAGLRGRKGGNYEGGIRAISLWRGPLSRQGQKVGRIAAHVDLAPTVLELAGKREPGLDGRSLVGELNGDGEQASERTLVLQTHRGLDPKPYQNAAIVSQKWKLVAGPDTFSDEAWPHSEDPPLELYDLESDPGERNDLAADHPDIVRRLKADYTAWFADVMAERNFAPGRIHLGSDEEPETLLCRYQDSSYVDGLPTTWPVHFEQAGRYEFAVRLEEEPGPGTIEVTMNGEMLRAQSDGGKAVLEIPEGDAELAVWFRPEGGEPFYPGDKNPWGDVFVLLVD